MAGSFEGDTLELSVKVEGRVCYAAEMFDFKFDNLHDPYPIRMADADKARKQLGIGGSLWSCLKKLARPNGLLATIHSRWRFSDAPQCSRRTRRRGTVNTFINVILAAPIAVADR